jgi:putative NADH-flavin reductase
MRPRYSTGMKVLIVGATGYVGKEVLRDCLARGHDVTVLARNPDAVADAPKLRKLKGDALDAAAVREAVKGQDAVIDAIGLSTSTAPKRGGNVPKGQGTTLFSVSAQHLVDAMKAEGVKRLIAMSNIGVGETRNAVPWIARKVIIPIAMPFLLAIFEDKERMEPIIMNSGLDWTIVRYNGITGDKPKGTKKVAMDGKVGMMMTVPDSAKFLVDQLDDRTYVGKAPSVSN